MSTSSWTEAIVTAAREKVIRQAEYHQVDALYSWGNPQDGLRFANLWANVTVWVSDNAVIANVPDTDDGRVWGYIAAYALDVDPEGTEGLNLYIEQTSEVQARIRLLSDEEYAELAKKYN